MKTIKRITRAIARAEQGFTLIELLAVMAIVAVLAGIVSTSVSGTNETSASTAAQQDATTVNTSASDFFSDQEGAAVITPHSATVEALITEVVGGVEVFDAPASVQQQKSTKWPEIYIVDDGTLTATGAYGLEFPITDPVNTTSGDVANLTIRGKDNADGTAGDIIDRTTLFEEYTAIDFDRLENDFFLDARTDSASQTTDSGFHDFLWLLRKADTAGGAGDDDSRTITVFKLTSIKVLVLSQPNCWQDRDGEA